MSSFDVERVEYGKQNPPALGGGLAGLVIILLYGVADVYDLGVGHVWKHG